MKTYKYLRAAAIVLVTAAFVLATAGCNTMEGAGKDVQQGGQAIEDAAD